MLHHPLEDEEPTPWEPPDLRPQRVQPILILGHPIRRKKTVPRRERDDGLWQGPEPELKGAGDNVDIGVLEGRIGVSVERLLESSDSGLGAGWRKRRKTVS